MPPFQWLAQVATLCRDVYLSSPATKALHVDGIEDFRHGDDYGCAYITPGTVYVAIRGSDSWDDWKSNVRLIGRANWHGMSVHRGFEKPARGMEKRVLEIISNHPGKRIVFCGHSRGGAIALLLAIAAGQHFPAQVVQCVTFGQPRVSTERQIRDHFGGEYIRVQNGSDVVTRWPKLGFSHAGTCLHLTNRGKKHWLLDPSVFATMTDRLLTFSQRASDHNINDYIEGLLECSKS